MIWHIKISIFNVRLPYLRDTSLINTYNMYLLYLQVSDIEVRIMRNYLKTYYYIAQWYLYYTYGFKFRCRVSGFILNIIYVSRRISINPAIVTPLWGRGIIRQCVTIRTELRLFPVKTTVPVRMIHLCIVISTYGGRSYL